MKMLALKLVALLFLGLSIFGIDVDVARQAEINETLARVVDLSVVLVGLVVPIVVRVREEITKRRAPVAPVVETK